MIYSLSAWSSASASKTKAAAMLTDSRPLLLDLFCGAGGASTGYYRAGFEVVGVDIEPQPHYPFEFIQANALEYVYKYGARFAAIHASPPCQFASAMFNPCKPEKRLEHVNLIPQTRRALKAMRRPYVIENVKGARKHLFNPLMLHGSMFALPIFRDRYFEINPAIWFAPAVPRRDYTPVPINGSGAKFALAADMASAVEIDWMTKMELRQAIPPAYTEFIGRHLMTVVKGLAHA
jgi:DNA (cytosine-5)-methyltransferase 1